MDLTLTKKLAWVILLKIIIIMIIKLTYFNQPVDIKTHDLIKEHITY